MIIYPMWTVARETVETAQRNTWATYENAILRRILLVWGSGCGGCIVLLDGKRVLACEVLIREADGRSVTII